MGSVRLPDTIRKKLEADGRLDRPAGPHVTFTVPGRWRDRGGGVVEGMPALMVTQQRENWPQALVYQCAALELPPPVRELRFHPVRRWRFDLAWPELRVACEIDGGAFAGGRHTSGPGFREDCVKLSEAAAIGWRVLRVMPEHVKDGQALAWLERALAVGWRDGAP